MLSRSRQRTSYPCLTSGCPGCLDLRVPEKHRGLTVQEMAPFFSCQECGTNYKAKCTFDATTKVARYVPVA